jgi:PTS system mannose-specific IID component
MTGRWRALWRLFAIQGAWNYERMLGIGMGYAAEPMLEDLKSADPARHADAVVRSSEFFNSHPYLAGVALGAIVRAEYDALPGPQILRLRTALCSPLGALGDRFFWAGLVPACVGLALVLLTAGLTGPALAGLLIVYNGIRLATAVWGLATGLGAGPKVGAAIGDSWLPRAAETIGPVAGFSIGVAIPMVAGWYLRAAGLQVLWVLALAALGVLLSWRFGAVATSPRFGLVTIGLGLLLAWGLR